MCWVLTIKLKFYNLEVSSASICFKSYQDSVAPPSGQHLLTHTDDTSVWSLLHFYFLLYCFQNSIDIKSHHSIANKNRESSLTVSLEQTASENLLWLDVHKWEVKWHDVPARVRVRVFCLTGSGEWSLQAAESPAEIEHCGAMEGVDPANTIHAVQNKKLFTWNL